MPGLAAARNAWAGCCLPCASVLAMQHDGGACASCFAAQASCASSMAAGTSGRTRKTRSMPACPRWTRCGHALLGCRRSCGWSTVQAGNAAVCRCLALAAPERPSKRPSCLSLRIFFWPLSLCCSVLCHPRRTWRWASTCRRPLTASSSASAATRCGPGVLHCVHGQRAGVPFQARVRCRQSATRTATQWPPCPSLPTRQVKHIFEDVKT